MSERETIEGHCLCGKIRIEIDDPSREIELCQCAMCRRWGGAFYSAQRSAAARVLGEENARVYRSSEWAERAFCETCGSNLWYRFLPTGNRSFSAGLFDATVGYAIDKEIFADEAAAWCQVTGNHPRQTGAETIAEARAAGFSFD